MNCILFFPFFVVIEYTRSTKHRHNCRPFFLHLNFGDFVYFVSLSEGESNLNWIYMFRLFFSFSIGLRIVFYAGNSQSPCVMYQKPSCHRFLSNHDQLLFFSSSMLSTIHLINENSTYDLCVHKSVTHSTTEFGEILFFSIF